MNRITWREAALLVGFALLGLLWLVKQRVGRLDGWP
jgi:hypothetical protein